MRALIVFLVLCLTSVLADFANYEPQVLNVPVDSTKPNGPSLSIHYYLKNNTNYKPGVPIFYGVAGRVPVEDILNQYQLFDETSDTFGGAIVVYAEQRFFGRSTGKYLTNANGLAELAQLTIKTVVSDHETIIRKLGRDFKTKNFLVFGGGHGGVIASHIAKRFQETDLKSNYNVLGWSSSPPIKYLKRKTYPVNGAANSIDVKDIGAKFAAIVTASKGVNADNTEFVCPIANIRNLFTKIRTLSIATDATNDYMTRLNLMPTPAIKAAAGAEPSDDQKELNIYLRNQLLSIAYDGYSYDASGNSQDGRIRKLCTALVNIADATPTPENFNAVLDVIGKGKLQWKVSDDGTGKTPPVPNQALLAATYQDCTEYQIVYCPQATGEATDPFGGSAANGGFAGAAGCANIDGFPAFIQAECTLLLKGLLPPNTNFDTTGKAPDIAAYPVAFNDHVVTTMNTQSLFATSLTAFGAADKNPANYADYYKLTHSDNWEFGKTHVATCDGAKTIKARYEILRAFGCVGSFVEDANKKTDFCKTPFTEGITDDTDTYPATCPEINPTTDPTNAKFPFGQTALTFTNPIPPPVKTQTTTPKAAGTTVASTQAPVTKGGIGFIPSAITLMTSGLLVWFATLQM